MNGAIGLLLVCTAIGLTSDRLTRRSYIMMGAAIVVYLVYAYRS